MNAPEPEDKSIAGLFKSGYTQSLKVMSAFQLNFRIIFAKDVKLFTISQDACLLSVSKLTCSLSLSVLNTSRQESRNSVQQTLPSQLSCYLTLSN